MPAPAADASTRTSTITRRLSEYMAGARRRELPPEVVEKAKHHILDTVAAMLSGSKLAPGRRAISFVRTQGGVKQASVLGTGFRSTAINAAMANGMLAHADETDDSHFHSNTHPGSAVVPAALAVAERQSCGGADLLRAVVLGYDIGCRVNQALVPDALRRRRLASHSIGGVFGAAAAAAAVLALDAQQMRHVLSYAAQQASGMRTWQRDPEHVEKAFVFAGMPARNGVTAALLVEDGCSGVDDVFLGDPNFLDVLADRPRRSELTAGLGERYEITHTNIKKWSVGSPIQSALDGTQALLARHSFQVADIERVVVHLPGERVATVDNRDMPDINLQHLIAVLIIDGTLSFHSTHDYARMRDPQVMALRRDISLRGSAALSKARPGRQAIVEIHTKTGRKVSRRVRTVRGTAANPMDRAEVEAKAQDLIEPVLGTPRTKVLLGAMRRLDKLKDVRALRELWRP